MTKNRLENDQEMTPNLYAYRYPSGKDPHEIRLKVGRRLDLNMTDWIIVTDQITSEIWAIRGTRCVADCKNICAVEAQKLSAN